MRQEPRRFNRRVGEDPSCEDARILENIPGLKAAVTKSDWASLQGYNQDNPTKNLVTQAYEADSKLEDDENGATSETEEVHNVVTALYN